MRIVGGSLSGRRFGGPVGTTRPTSERVREALGSVLESRDLVRDAVVLDLFSGTGALSFELLSRGAARAVGVERDSRARTAIERSARDLGLSDRMRVRSVDLLGAPRAVAETLRHDGPFDLVVADAPWAHVAQVPALLLALHGAGALPSGATAVIEHATREPIDLPVGLATAASYRYGDTSVVLAVVEETS